jgi:hypothetical protein
MSINTSGPTGYSPKNPFAKLAASTSQTSSPQKTSPPKKMRGRIGDHTVSQNVNPSTDNIYPQPQPQPLPSIPSAKLEMVRTTELPAETNKVIKKELTVKINNEKYNCGTEEAKTIATLDLSIDYQTMQFAYWVNAMKDIQLRGANLTRFMEAMDVNSVNLWSEMNIDPEALKEAKNPKTKGPFEYPEFLDANGKLDPVKQKEVDLIFYGMIHAAGMRRKSQYYKSKALDFIKSGTVRATEGGQKMIPSVLINARYQTYTSENQTANNIMQGAETHCEALRTGSLYDVRDPGNTIAELESYLNDGSTLRLDQEIYRRESEIHSLKTNISLKLNTQERANKIYAVKESLIPLYELKKFKEDQATAALTAVLRKMEEKKRFIDDLMVQLIMFQVSQNLDSLDGNTFTFSYEGLLNELKSKKNHVIDSSGLIMDEGNILQEMEGAFQRFAGKKLIFDQSGPYLSREGHLHLPYAHPESANKVMTLEPILFNLTVNGSTTNNPMQAKINTGAIEQLTAKINTLKENRPDLNKQLGEIQRKLNKVRINLSQGNSNFEMASELLACQFTLRNLMKEHHLGCFAIAVGCYSAKDRTAIVMELAILQYAIDQQLEKAPKLNREKKKQIREGLINLIPDPQGMSAEISFENTGNRVIKYLEVFLPGQEITISSLAKATLYKVDQARTFLNHPILE